MRKILCLTILCLILAGCAAAPAPTEPVTTAPTVTEPPTTPPTDPPTEPPTDPPDPIAEQVASMTTAEKVGQLFLARYDGNRALSHTEQYALGGWILFSSDFEGETPDSIREEIAALQAASDIPLLIAVDEEGGTVTRVSRFSAFRDSKFAHLF